MFESVYGHTKITQMLTNMLNKDAIPNAFCFHGVNGIGKRRIGRELAQAMFCKTKTACGSCLPCVKFAKGLLPDYHEIGPEGRDIKVGPIREITENLHYTPFETPYRIYLLDRVETMNDGAANAFLKSLEEPPDYVYFILITSDIDKLLPTIRSRCQKISFQPLSPVDKEDILIHSFQLDPQLAFNLARISFRQLETDQHIWELFQHNVHIILSFFETMIREGLAIDFLSNQLRSKDELPRFLDHFLACLREALFRSKGLPSRPLFEPWQDRFKELTLKTQPEDWIQALDDYFYLMSNMKRNLNMSLWFNQFSVNGLGQYRKSENRHRDWLIKKGKIQRVEPSAKSFAIIR